MAVITFPSALRLSSMAWAPHRQDVAFSSPFGSQAVGISGPKWAVSIMAPLELESAVGEWKSLIMQVEGKVDQMELWDFNRPAPLGTMRGTMTLNAAMAQGAVSMQIVAAGEAGKTLRKGDMLGFGSGTTQQVVIVTNDPTADGTGVINVNFRPAARNAFAIGAAVVWDKPKALFRMTVSDVGWEYLGGLKVKVGSMSLIEDWRA